jgi:hypothetical protein
MNGNGKGLIPSFSDLNKYAVNRGGEYEGIRQTLYDFQAYAQGGQTSLTFFQVPQGQSSKTLFDTNMEVAGSLPAPKHFLVQSIEIYFFPSTNPVSFDATGDYQIPTFANDMYTVYKSGWLNFFIGSKSYLTEAPIGRFPPKTKLETEFAFALATQTAANGVGADYASWTGRPYFVDPPVLLTPTQNFNVTLNWPTAVTVTGTSRIGIVLDGVLYRLSQ